MNPQVTITARNNGKYLVHFYNNQAESNVNFDTLQEALDFASGFLKAVERNRKTEVPAER